MAKATTHPSNLSTSSLSTTHSTVSTKSKKKKSSSPSDKKKSPKSKDESKKSTKTRKKPMVRSSSSKSSLDNFPRSRSKSVPTPHRPRHHDGGDIKPASKKTSSNHNAIKPSKLARKGSIGSSAKPVKQKDSDKSVTKKDKTTKLKAKKGAKAKSINTIKSKPSKDESDTSSTIMDAEVQPAWATGSTSNSAAMGATNTAEAAKAIAAKKKQIEQDWEAKRREAKQQQQLDDDWQRKKDALGEEYASETIPEETKKPGAYLVQGSSQERAQAGLLSPHDETNQNQLTLYQGNNNNYYNNYYVNNNQDDRDYDGNEEGDNGAFKSSSHHASSSSGHDVEVNDDGITVAATLTSEAQIEEEVRQKILKQAVHADIIAVEHDTPEDEQAKIDEMKKLHRHKSIRERLFGDARTTTEVDIATTPESIRKRDLLKWTVKRNEASGRWIVNINTSQKALEGDDKVVVRKATKTFSASTQLEAFELGLAMATPRMLPFEDYPICQVCQAKFAVFRRPHHCRNCGVCVCSACCVSWPSKMIPTTYNIKNEASVKVCLACDWISSSFRNALLRGKYQKAIDLYSTGNVNLRCAFANVSSKSEVLYPVHCAVRGGNMRLVKWLVSTHFCPLRETPTKKSKKGASDPPLLSSKGHSALGIALLDQKLDIVRYLVAERNMTFAEEKDLTSWTTFLNFTTLLKMLPEDFFEKNDEDDDSSGDSGMEYDDSSRTFASF